MAIYRLNEDVRCNTMKWLLLMIWCLDLTWLLAVFYFANSVVTIRPGCSFLSTTTTIIIKGQFLETWFATCSCMVFCCLLSSCWNCALLASFFTSVKFASKYATQLAHKKRKKMTTFQAHCLPNTGWKPKMSANWAHYALTFQIDSPKWGARSKPPFKSLGQTSLFIL